MTQRENKSTWALSGVSGGIISNSNCVFSLDAKCAFSPFPFLMPPFSFSFSFSLSLLHFTHFLFSFHFVLDFFTLINSFPPFCFVFFLFCQNYRLNLINLFHIVLLKVPIYMQPCYFSVQCCFREFDQKTFWS